MALEAQSLSFTRCLGWPFIYVVRVSEVKGVSVRRLAKRSFSNQNRSVCGQETRKGSHP